MKDEKKNRFFSDKETCNLKEKIRRNISRITEQEEAKFDLDHSDHGNTYIDIHYQRIKPFNTTLFSRLNNRSFHTRGIEKRNAFKGINRILEGKHQGSSKINKVILEKCTDKGLDHVHVTNICNTGFPSA